MAYTARTSRAVSADQQHGWSLHGKLILHINQSISNYSGYYVVNLPARSKFDPARHRFLTTQLDRDGKHSDDERDSDHSSSSSSSFI